MLRTDGPLLACAVLAAVTMLACGDEPEPATDTDIGGADTDADVASDDSGVSRDTDTDDVGDDVGDDTPTVDVDIDAVADADAAGDTTPFDAPPPPDPTFEDISDLLQLRCTPCHTDRVSGGLSLLAGDQLHDRLLAESTQAAPFPRIAPNETDRSYLLAKLRGEQSELGGRGSRMPLNRTPLSDDELDLLERWVELGAPGPE